MENFFALYTNRSSSSSSATPNQEPTMGMFGSLISPPARFQIRPSSVMMSTTVPADQRSKQEKELTVGSGSSSSNATNEVETMKTKIIFHPQFPNLLQSYIECQKVGAPAEVAARLDSTWREFERNQRSSIGATNREESKDPELDQFMEAYSDMIMKYREEVTRPVQEAMEFMQKIESQLNIITNCGLRLHPTGTEADVGGSSSSEEEMNGGDESETKVDPRAEDGELKKHLLRKYSGYLSNLKQELSKKKKVRKLPKEARQRLLSWWELHYKWPYPSESEKAGLAETTGLDQKQINNWFINQRKRHWKPNSEDDDMNFMGPHFMAEAPNYRFRT